MGNHRKTLVVDKKRWWLVKRKKLQIRVEICEQWRLWDKRNRVKEHNTCLKELPQSSRLRLIDSYKTFTIKTERKVRCTEWNEDKGGSEIHIQKERWKTNAVTSHRPFSPPLLKMVFTFSKIVFQTWGIELFEIKESSPWRVGRKISREMKTRRRRARHKIRPETFSGDICTAKGRRHSYSWSWKRML